jgi:hypothetical protein
MFWFKSKKEDYTTSLLMGDCGDYAFIKHNINNKPDDNNEI